MPFDDLRNEEETPQPMRREYERKMIFLTCRLIGHRSAAEFPFYIFGQHLTRFWPEDFERIRKLWHEISEKESGAEIRHRDIVSVAVLRLDNEFHSDQESKILNEIHREALEQKHGTQAGSEQSED